MSGSLDYIKNSSVYNAYNQINFNPPVVKDYKEPETCHRCYIIPHHMEKKLRDHLSSDESTKDNAHRHWHLSHNFRNERSFHSHEREKTKVVAEPFFGHATTRTPNFKVFTADNGTDLPGKAIDPTKDADAANAVNAAKATVEFYSKNLNRNSIDNKGEDVVSTVHYDKNYNNAFWTGKSSGNQMVYGEGDQKVFGDFTKPLDVIGHELTHGVTEDLSNLVYKNQPGALNESLSDCFGKMVEGYTLHQQGRDSEFTPYIGHGLILPYEGKTYDGLRNMEHPGTAYKGHPVLGDDPQPSTMGAFVKLPADEDDDEGGVHINSGIPNGVFWDFYTNLKVQGVGSGNIWDIPAKVWYETAEKINSRTDFRHFGTTSINSVDTLKNVLHQEGVDYAKVKDILHAAWVKAQVL